MNFYATIVNGEIVCGMLSDQDFDSKFEFHESSIYDVPPDNDDVRTFCFNNEIVIHTTSAYQLGQEVEGLLIQRFIQQ